MAPRSEPPTAKSDAIAAENLARGDWEYCIRREIPAALLGRDILAKTADFSLWLEDFRGYSKGFTFTVRLVVSKNLLERFDLTFGPSFLDRFPATEVVNFWLLAEGRRYSNKQGQLDRNLVLIGGGATPQVSWAQWWVAEASMPEIQIGFDWSSIGVGGSHTIRTAEWQETIAKDLLLLPTPAP